MKNKKHPEDRPVRDWFGLGIAFLQFAAAVVNAVFNYPFQNACQMGTSLRVEAGSLGFQPIA